MIRVLSGVILASAALGLVWYGTTALLLGAAVAVCLLALHEYRGVMRAMGVGVPMRSTAPATLATLVAAVFADAVPVAGVAGLSLVVVAAHALVRVGSEDLRAVSTAVAASVLPVVYLGASLGSLVGVHRLGGRAAVIALLGTIAVSDTAQYYSGRAFGRRPLAPTISPKKTREGAVGGLLVAPLALVAAGPALVPDVGLLWWPIIGVALVAAGIAGDLFESLLKRAAHVKDSSTLIPGHGGVLDRIDALLFASPIFYLFIWWTHRGF